MRQPLSILLDHMVDPPFQAGTLDHIWYRLRLYTRSDTEIDDAADTQLFELLA
jgi:hypothetical protein